MFSAVSNKATDSIVWAGLMAKRQRGPQEQRKREEKEKEISPLMSKEKREGEETERDKWRKMKMRGI